MVDSSVDHSTLEDSEATLRRLKGEFDDIEGRRDDTGGIWGHDSVRDAMHEFASNMDYNRRKLSRTRPRSW